VHAGGRCVQVDALDHAALHLALADEGSEEFACALALGLDLDRLIPPGAQVLDALIQPNSEVVSREAQDLAHRGGDS